MPTAGPISVVTVNFNAGPLLAECVRSVLGSTVPVEVIVVDNHSTDDSLAVLKAAVDGEPRVVVIENAANVGFARANNQALARTTGEFVLLLNPDCVIRPDTLEGMLEVMSCRPDVGMAGCLILNPDGTEQAGCRRSVPTPWRSFVRVFHLSRIFPQYRRLFDDYVLKDAPLPATPVEVEAISGAFMFVRRTALDEVGTLDEVYFMHCEDLDWCMRFRQHGRPILFVPGVSITHDKGRCGRDRPIRVLWHMHRGMIRFYRKFFRHQYPAVLMWLVIAGVGLRFAAKAAVTFVQGTEDNRAR